MGHGQRGGCTTPPFMVSPSLFVFVVLARRSRTAPAERDKTGATPLFLPLARLWGRSRLNVSLLEGSTARPGARLDAPTSGALRDRILRAFLVAGGVSAVAAWTGPGVCPEADPGAGLVRHDTPNVSNGCRRLVRRRAGRGRVTRRPICCRHVPDLVRPDGRQGGAPRAPSPLATFAHVRPPGLRHRRGISPVTLTASPSPDWRIIPARGLYPGVAMFVAVGSGKPSACMPPFRAPALALAGR